MNAIMRSFVKGMLPGVVSRAQFPQAQKEPVAYLYNGVELPVLPSGYEESHPHQFIWLDITGNYGLLLSDAKFAASDAGVTTEGTCRQYVFVPNDAEYTSWEFMISRTGKTVNSEQTHLWTNHDILNEDGTVYLEASEPVPVYE